jgi:hypothetical protein
MKWKIRQQVHATPQIQAVSSEFLVVEINRSFVGRGNSRDAADQGGLAGPIWPEQTDDLSGFNQERNPVERPNRTIGFQDSSKLDIHLRDEDKKRTGKDKLLLDRQAGVFPSVDAAVEMVNGLKVVLLKNLQRLGAAAA